MSRQSGYNGAMSRVIKKRRKKMRKHKYRKLRKRTRHQRRK